MGNEVLSVSQASLAAVLSKYIQPFAENPLRTAGAEPIPTGLVLWFLFNSLHLPLDDRRKVLERPEITGVEELSDCLLKLDRLLNSRALFSALGNAGAGENDSEAESIEAESIKKELSGFYVFWGQQDQAGFSSSPEDPSTILGEAAQQFIINTYFQSYSSLSKLNASDLTPPDSAQDKVGWVIDKCLKKVFRVPQFPMDPLLLEAVSWFLSCPDRHTMSEQLVRTSKVIMSRALQVSVDELSVDVFEKPVVDQPSETVRAEDASDESLAKNVGGVSSFDEAAVDESEKPSLQFLPFLRRLIQAASTEKAAPELNHALAFLVQTNKPYEGCSTTDVIATFAKKNNRTPLQILSNFFQEGVYRCYPSGFPAKIFEASATKSAEQRLRDLLVVPMQQAIEKYFQSEGTFSCKLREMFGALPDTPLGKSYQRLIAAMIFDGSISEESQQFLSQRVDVLDAVLRLRKQVHPQLPALEGDQSPSVGSQVAEESATLLSHISQCEVQLNGSDPCSLPALAHQILERDSLVPETVFLGLVNEFAKEFVSSQLSANESMVQVLCDEYLDEVVDQPLKDFIFTQPGMLKRVQMILFNEKLPPVVLNNYLDYIFGRTLNFRLIQMLVRFRFEKSLASDVADFVEDNDDRFEASDTSGFRDKASGVVVQLEQLEARFRERLMPRDEVDLGLEYPPIKDDQGRTLKATDCYLWRQLYPALPAPLRVPSNLNSRTQYGTNPELKVLNDFLLNPADSLTINVYQSSPSGSYWPSLLKNHTPTASCLALLITLLLQRNCVFLDGVSEQDTGVREQVLLSLLSRLQSMAGHLSATFLQVAFLIFVLVTKKHDVSEEDERAVADEESRDPRLSLYETIIGYADRNRVDDVPTPPVAALRDFLRAELFSGVLEALPTGSRTFLTGLIPPNTVSPEVGFSLVRYNADFPASDSVCLTNPDQYRSGQLDCVNSVVLPSVPAVEELPACVKRPVAGDGGEPSPKKAAGPGHAGFFQEAQAESQPGSPRGCDSERATNTP